MIKIVYLILVIICDNARTQSEIVTAVLKTTINSNNNPTVIVRHNGAVPLKRPFFPANILQSSELAKLKL